MRTALGSAIAIRFELFQDSVLDSVLVQLVALTLARSEAQHAALHGLTFLQFFEGKRLCFTSMQSCGDRKSVV